MQTPGVIVPVMPFTSHVKVRFYELDPYNHLNHAAYIQYFESARVELLEEAGISLASLKDQGYLLVVTDLAIRYLRSAGPNEVLRIETEIAEMRRVSSRWRQRMYRGDELMAEQEIQAATTTAEGRPVRFPEAMAEALSPYFAG